MPRLLTAAVLANCNSQVHTKYNSRSEVAALAHQHLSSLNTNCYSCSFVLFIISAFLSDRCLTSVRKLLAAINEVNREIGEFNQKHAGTMEEIVRASLK
ncbi:MAG: hypothetical protein F6K55_20245 [Moorea sp. SIO4A3]|nr:hypothetical protein [Moorena sp. SIO4A3]NEQ88749.1 hypothetical protein [Moorena sp. SIO2I5]